MSKTAFERYAPFIQEYIYRKKWNDLREVQVEACEAILDTNKHVIIASGTASGKTEAAFFPILTLLTKRPSTSIGVLYIGPLKALINDQFERLNDLLEEQDIPVWPWHGDVSQTMKERAVKTSQGILQITPESLEALLMRNPGNASRLFSDLRFIVIDEIHAFMGEDRGLQVLCLIARLEKLTGVKPRRVGLSATLNDYQPAMDFLASGSTAGTVAVGIQKHKRSIALSSEGFIIPKNEKLAEQVMNQYYEFIYENCHAKKCLIFTNSRGTAEKAIDHMKSIAIRRNERDVFYVHHGSISASLRLEAEKALRDEIGPTVTAATLTLELGIDIGDLDSTIQLGAPYSCSSFVQRLGRSGRRTGKSQMLFVNIHPEKDKNSLDELPWDLLRSIAIIQLYLEERWVEPFVPKKKPFSLLVHQTLSILMTYGELSPRELAQNVLLLPPFRSTITIDEYKEVLQHMIQNDYLQKMDSGSIIIGLKGERMTNHYTFYAVFQDEEVYHVISKDYEVGTISNCPAEDEVFILAGRAWKTVSIDIDRKKIYVTQSKSHKIPTWTGSGGEIHTKILRRMKRVLQEDLIYKYLQPNAVKMLVDARIFAAEHGFLDSSILLIGTNRFLILPWVGTKEVRTIAKLLSYGLKKQLDIYSVVSTHYYMEVTSGLSIESFFERFRDCSIDMNNPDEILQKDQTPKVDKFDGMLPNDLLRSAFLYNQMDVPSAIQIMNELGNL